MARLNLVMARLLVALVIAHGALAQNPPPFLPFVPLPYLPWLSYVAIVGGGMVLVGAWPRAGCAAVGATMLWSVLSSRVGFHNHIVFTAFLFLLLALGETWALRAQVAVMYVGAAASKVFEPDWWSGAFFVAFAREAHHAVPSPSVARAACVSAMAIELALPVLLYRAPRAGIVIGVAFHTALSAYRGSTFGFYYPAVLVSYLAFWDLYLRYSARNAARYPASSSLIRWVSI